MEAPQSPPMQVVMKHHQQEAKVEDKANLLDERQAIATLPSLVASAVAIATAATAAANGSSSQESSIPVTQQPQQQHEEEEEGEEEEEEHGAKEKGLDQQWHAKAVLETQGGREKETAISLAARRARVEAGALCCSNFLLRTTAAAALVSCACWSCSDQKSSGGGTVLNRTLLLLWLQR